MDPKEVMEFFNKMLHKYSIGTEDDKGEVNVAVYAYFPG